MTSKEKYKIYCDMFDAIPERKKRLIETLENSGCKIISDVFVSVGNEEKLLHFVDVEFLDKNGNYNRMHGLKNLYALY